MDDTEKRISTYAGIAGNDRGMFVPLKESLGLRAHMQDELLRIEQMLAKEDPELLKLLDFDISHPRVVKRLRELNAKGRVIQAIAETSDQESDGSEALSSVTRNMGVQLDPTIVKTINKQVSVTETASSSQPSQIGTDAIHIDLSVRHNEVSIVSNIDLSVTHNKVSMVSNIDLSVRHNKVSMVSNIDLSGSNGHPRIKVP